MNHRIPKSAAALLLAAVAPLCGETLDLDAAIATALARNPALKAVEELRRQVDGGVIEARADAFPQITLAGSWGRSRSPSLLNSPDFEEIISQFPGAFSPSVQELSAAQIEVSQPLFRFGKISAAIDLAKLVVEAADARIATARLDTALAAAEAYYGVLSAREGLQTIESERLFRRHDLERIQDLLEIGEATELERLRAVSALAVVEPEVELRRGQVAVAETQLRQVLGLEPGAAVELAPGGAVLGELPVPEELLTEALAGRPELSDLAFQAEAYERQKKVYRADGLPHVDATGRWGREVRLVENFDDPLYSSWAFGVGLRWELFDGGRRKGQIAQAESQRQQLVLQRADLEAQIRLQVDQAFTDYRTARARAESSRAAADVAQEAERVARESYEQGVATQTDLLDAQRQAVQAEVTAVESFYDARIRASRLSRAVGKMPGASGISR